MCGYPKSEHSDKAIKPEDFTGESWDINRHVHEVPTDAYGDINFGGMGLRTGKVHQLSTFKMSASLPHSLCLADSPSVFIRRLSVRTSVHRHQA